MTDHDMQQEKREYMRCRGVDPEAVESLQDDLEQLKEDYGRATYVAAVLFD